MRKPLTGSIVLVAALIFSPALFAQSAAPPQGVAQNPPRLYQQLAKDTSTGGPAPVRELTGVWAGVTPKKLEAPPMTVLGQKIFNLNKPEGKFSLAFTNDPWKTCDPFGFPRAVLNETIGISFAQMPGRVLQLFKYQKIWREIWTDGRELPKNVGQPGAPDPRWYGYSIGHWDGDYTFVVETTGSDDRSWVDGDGYPHSVEAHFEERYTRANHNTLDMTVTIDDPKMYTKPWLIAKNDFKWNPDQEFEEQLCVPSEGIAYIDTIGIPAGNSAGVAPPK